MTETLQNVVRKIDLLPNPTNSALVREFHLFMRRNGSSERNQKNSLKAVMAFGHHLGETSFLDLSKKEQILAFLDGKQKSKEEDPDERWKTTWNSYLTRIKNFLRWAHNQRGVEEEIPYGDWETPAFARIKEKRSKRLSPYSEHEIWDRDEIIFISKYEPNPRNRAIILHSWDIDARPEEITLFKIKHIRLRERYGEGIVSPDAKTGSGPVLLTVSFVAVRDWLNLHQFSTNPEAPLYYNSKNGKPLKPDSIWRIMMALRARVERILQSARGLETSEKEKLEYLLKEKNWAPYCIRHSAISSDSDYLPGYALNKKVRWSMNSKQPARYIKSRLSDDLKRTILQRNGITMEEASNQRPLIVDCPRCNYVNSRETKFCSRCAYPLSDGALNEIKAEERSEMETIIEKKVQEIMGRVDIKKLF